MRRTLALAGIVVSLLTAAAPAEAAGVTYVYDGQGRVTTASYSNGTVITYTYDTAGNITAQQVTCSSSGC